MQGFAIVTDIAPLAIIGANGQVARALVSAAGKRGIAAVAAGRGEADITNQRSLETLLARVRPWAVVNAAAYTAVDKAESEPEAAFRVNAEGPALLALLCARLGLPLIHISTDYVFGGHGHAPLGENEPLAPANVYAASKAAGEAAVRDNSSRHIILRTAWVYDEEGANFMRTMLRLALTREEIGVVDDQLGSPTYAADLAEGILAIAAAPAGELERKWGTYHLTNAGETTWAGFAREIFARAGALGFRTARVRPIPTAQYPTPAKRPAYSVLDTGKIERAFGIRLPPWQDALQRCLARTQPIV